MGNKNLDLILENFERKFYSIDLDPTLRDLARRMLPLCSNYSLIVRFIEGSIFIGKQFMIFRSQRNSSVRKIKFENRTNEYTDRRHIVRLFVELIL